MRAELIYYHAQGDALPHPSRRIPGSYLEIKASGVYSGGISTNRERHKKELVELCAALSCSALSSFKLREPKALENIVFGLGGVEVRFAGGQLYEATYFMPIVVSQRIAKEVAAQLTSFGDRVFGWPIAYCEVGFSNIKGAPEP